MQRRLRRAVLALDNHGKVVAGGATAEKDKVLDQSIAAYHQFSGSAQIALFQLLDSPPKGGFSRALLVFSVAEAMLTRIAVVDERLADATVEWDGDNPRSFGARALEMQKARIYPLYSVHSERLDKSSGKSAPYVHPLSSTARSALANPEVTTSQEFHLNEEGLHVSPYSNAVNSPAIASATPVWIDKTKRLGKLDCCEGFCAPDFIVIHEGVTDLLYDAGAWPKGAHEELYLRSSAVIRTSGRGSISRHLGSDLPFLEFSELSDSTYRQMNKVALAKGLLSVRGM